MSERGHDTISPESRQLHAFALHVVRRDSRPLVFDASLDADLLLAVARKHKVLSLLAQHAQTGDVIVPASVATRLDAALARNRRRSDAFTREAIDTQAQLRHHGIASLVRKGVAYNELIYGGTGSRRFGDIDLYIGPSQAAAASALLRSNGYFHGAVHDDGETIIHWGRRELLPYTLYPDHLPQFIRTHDEPDVPWVAIDISLDIGWHGAPLPPGRHALLSTLLAAPVVLPSTLRTLPVLHHFVDCALHLYRDAYFERYIVLGSDVNLLKFIDLALLWQGLNATERDELRSFAVRHGFTAQLAWTAVHLDDLLQTDVTTTLDLHALVRDGSANTWEDSQGRTRRWRGSMLERLFAPARVALLEGLR